MFSRWYLLLTRENEQLRDLGILLLRLWFGVVLSLGHGLPKITGLESFVQSVGRRGIPVPELTAPFAAASEFFGGLLLAVGLLTRPAAVAVVGTMSVAAFVVHAQDPFSKKEFALAYAVAALVLAVAGPGRFSVDAWLRHRLGKRDD